MGGRRGSGRPRQVLVRALITGLLSVSSVPRPISVVGNGMLPPVAGSNEQYERRRTRDDLLSTHS